MYNTDKYIWNKFFVIDKTKVTLNEKQIKLIEKFCKKDIVNIANSTNEQLDILFDNSQSNIINSYNKNELTIKPETFFKRVTDYKRFMNIYYLNESFWIAEELLFLFHSLDLLSEYKKDLVFYDSKLIKSLDNSFIIRPYKF